MLHAVPPATDDDLLTPSQVAALLGCSARTVTRWAEAGRLPVAVTVPGPNGTRLYRRSDVDKLAKEKAA